jgi:hypothetical protein
MIIRQYKQTKLDAEIESVDEIETEDINDLVNILGKGSNHIERGPDGALHIVSLPNPIHALAFYATVCAVTFEEGLWGAPQPADQVDWGI